MIMNRIFIEELFYEDVLLKNVVDRKLNNYNAYVTEIQTFLHYGNFEIRQYTLSKRRFSSIDAKEIVLSYLNGKLFLIYDNDDNDKSYFKDCKFFEALQYTCESDTNPYVINFYNKERFFDKLDVLLREMEDQSNGQAD